MKASRLIPVAVLGLALALVLFAVLRQKVETDSLDEFVEAPAPSADVAEGDAGAGGAEGEQAAPAPSAGLRTVRVTVYYPAAGARGLVAEPREIFETGGPGDRAKQILADLISGPSSGGATRAVPPGTRLRQIFVLEGDTAYVDFSSELSRAMNGGTRQELLTVYSIVDSVALNVPEIRRVGILINGRQVDSLSGHIDLRYPLTPDRSWILRG